MAAATATTANTENVNVWVQSCGAVAERHAAELLIFFSFFCPPPPRTMERIVPLPQGLRSVVCIPAIFVVVVVVVLFCFVLFCYVGLLSTASEVSDTPATVMLDNYEKSLTQVV